MGSTCGSRAHGPSSVVIPTTKQELMYFLILKLITNRVRPIAIPKTKQELMYFSILKLITN